ncbi:hypothetical protein ABW19_dt0210127 [Dactylella cylindrospora]|nr:hypothetical protein ABW19_dt0210127 [Dactylella cylindrospora]
MALYSQETLPSISTQMAIESLVYPRMQVIKTANLSLVDDRRGSVSTIGSPEETRSWGSPRGMDFLTASAAPIPGELSGPSILAQQQEGDVNMSSIEQDAESYPPPPPAPVPQHAKLPASPGKKVLPPPPPPTNAQGSTAMSPPSIPGNLPRNGGQMNGINGMGSNGDRMFMPMPSPGRGVHAVLPPSPLRHSMSIIEADDDGNEAERAIGKDIEEREGKRIKIDDGSQSLPQTQGSEARAFNNGNVIGTGAKDEDDEDDSDADIPEIIMEDSDDE